VYGMPLANKKIPSEGKNNDMIMTVDFRAKMYAVRMDGKKEKKGGRRKE